MNATELNLDCPNQVDEFISTFGYLRGRALAKKLGLKGKNSVKTANNLYHYVLNKLVAMTLRKNGDINGALMYESICDSIYRDLPQDIRW